MLKNTTNEDKIVFKELLHILLHKIFSNCVDIVFDREWSVHKLQKIIRSCRGDLAASMHVYM